MRILIITLLFLFPSILLCFEPFDVKIVLDREKNESLVIESEEFYFTKISKDQSTILGRALTENGVNQLKSLYTNITFHVLILFLY